jgi:secreted trypsin-like serine protease
VIGEAQDPYDAVIAICACILSVSAIRGARSMAVDAFNNVVVQDGNSNMQTCHGDSGGPAFQGSVVVGVTSFGQDRSATSVCFGGGFHCRVDADVAFINANTN